jgi:hypothetical protein
MLESILKVIFGFMMIVLYCQRILLPHLGIMQEKQLTLIKLEKTLVNYRGTGKEKETKRLKIQNHQIQEGFKVLETYLPYLNSKSGNVEQKFNDLKSKIPGDWQISKNPTFQTDNMVVRWPYKIQFDGMYKDAIKALAFIESKGQISKIKRMKMARLAGNKVRLNADLDILFLKSELKEQEVASGGIK